MSDDDLISELRGVLDTMDQDTGTSRELAYAALGWRDVDTELAELVFDSEVDEAEVLVRSAEDHVRLLTFSTDRVTIEVELAAGRLIGQVVPPAATTIELVEPDGTVLATTNSDEIGVFTLQEIPPGPAALVCRAIDGSWSIRTSWTSASPRHD